MAKITLREILEQMKSLQAHCEDMVDKEDPDSIWRSDVEALGSVIGILERMERQSFWKSMFLRWRYRLLHF